MANIKTLILDGLVVGDDGSISRTDGKSITPHLAHGYLVVKYNSNRYRVHRLVAEAFLLNNDPKNFTDVNHIDGDKTNNKVSNLEWCTRRYNLHHAMRSGLHANPEKAVIGWNPDTGEGVWFISTAKAGEYGFTQPNVVHCLKGNRAKCKGFHWEYA